MGIEYQEARCRKRERPPLNLAVDSVTNQIVTTSNNPGRGTFSTLGIHNMFDPERLEKPAILKANFSITDDDEETIHIPQRDELPYGTYSQSLTGLKTIYDDKSLFPKYILEHEQKMHAQLQQAIEQEKVSHKVSNDGTNRSSAGHKGRFNKGKAK